MIVNLDDRLGYFLLGCFIGAVVGYMLRYLQKIDRNVGKVQDAVTKKRHEEGLIRYPWALDIALLAVVIVTVWAAFSSAAASDKVKNNQENIEKITYCNQAFLSKTIVALNERTTYSRAQSDANVELQTGFLAFLRVLQFQPPKPESERVAAFNGYVKKLDNYVELNKKTKDKAAENPFPTATEFSDCLDKSLSDIKKEIQHE